MSGDVRAQLRFYDLHCNRVYSSAYRILKNAQEAEDIMQETFIQAYKSFNQLQDHNKVGSWLSRIASNKSLNYIKRNRSNWMELTEDMAVEDESIDNQEDGISAEDIKRCIASLPEGFRVIVTLYLIEGYDHSTIAHELGIAESTSRSQYTRARRKLSELIRERHGRQIEGQNPGFS